jgi:hypothetical protein
VNPKVHYRVHKSLPLDPILSKMQSFHTLRHIYLRPIWILSFHLRLGHLVPTKTLYALRGAPMRATCPDHHILLDFTILILLGEKYKLYSSWLINFLQFAASASLLGTTISSPFRSQTPWSQFSPLMWTSKLHIHIKLNTKLQFCIF